MTFEYCVDCGAKNIITANFCSKCGTGLKTGIEAPKKIKPEKKKNLIFEEDDNGNDEEPESIPTIESLKANFRSLNTGSDLIQTEYGQRRKRIGNSLEQLAIQQAAKYEPEKRRRLTKKEQKQLLNETFSQAKGIEKPKNI